MSAMTRKGLLVLALVLAAVAQRALTAQPPAFSFAEPGISPDGREIAFTSGGDIWSVPATGGDARLLVSHEATERRPLFSPDGQWLAFMSTRTGGGDIYLLSLPTGQLRRLTSDDGVEQLEGWSRDGRWVYFTSTSRDIAAMNDVYRVLATGGTPMAVSDDRYLNEYGATASPDGRSLVLSARGIGGAQWWRRGSSHIDRSELWRLDNLDGTPTYTQLTSRDSRQSWPMWSADGRAVYYVSDRGGAENLWRRALPGAVDPEDPTAVGEKLTTFTGGRVLFPSLSADGRVLAFERDFGIWTIDTASSSARQVPITLRGASTAPVAQRLRQTNGFTDLRLSPDGRKVVFVSRGILFAASARDGGDATRVTMATGLVSQPTWAPDSRRVAYVAARGDSQRLYLYDFPSSTETPLTTTQGVDISPVFSPDGAEVAFLRDRKELRVIGVESRTERLLASGMFADAIDRPLPVWGPGGQWIAAFMIGAKSFTNVHLIPARGPSGPARPVSSLANVYANTIAWASDGQALYFDTRQRTELGQLMRVDLVPRAPRFREDLFRDLFIQNSRPATPAPAAPAAAPATQPTAPTTPAPATPFTPVFDGIRNRLSPVPLGFDVQEVSLSPDGKTALVTAIVAGQTNLYTYSLDELATERPVARQLTTSSGNKSAAQFSPDGREVYYLEGGRIQIATVERRESRPLAVTAEYTSDFADERLEVFRQAWTLLRDNFYDTQFNGVNWERSRETYGPRVQAVSNPDEMRRVMSLMIGDLNASHLGISGAGGGASVVGRLGLRFDRREWESSGRLRVTEVLPLGPAALAGNIARGDYLRRIGSTDVRAGVSVDEALAHTSDRRVPLQVSTTADGATRDVVVKPMDQAAEKALLYRHWVETNREYVLKRSGGRLGYVHMINMSAAALDQLYIDLDVDNHARDGVVIDLRNNSGGFVNAYALDVFSRQPYLRMSLRGLPESPARTVLGQRALESPTVLVTNQHSLSDAEDFTEGYRALKLGPIVGEPTAGWIIYTWNTQLFDGSTLRLPRMRVRAGDGTDMENVPRPVDVEVTRPLGEWGTTPRDTQLDEAVRALLRRLGILE